MIYASLLTFNLVVIRTQSFVVGTLLAETNPRLNYLPGDSNLRCFSPVNAISLDIAAAKSSGEAFKRNIFEISRSESYLLNVVGVTTSTLATQSYI